MGAEQCLLVSPSLESALVDRQIASSTATPTFTATDTASSQPPALPERPTSLSTVVNRTAQNYSPYGQQQAYGASPYGGGLGGYNSYGSPYSRLGGMGGMGGMYGGMGGMGGMYGGGYGYPGRPGMMGEDPNSLTNSFNQSTQTTFHMIENVVGAFQGFAGMLESTYMATHSSFYGRQTNLRILK